MKTSYLLLLCLTLPELLLAQGSLTPPGPPSPLFKTLEQVEPRTIVNAANTPGNATNSFNIGKSGSYYLTENILGAAGKNGISIEASGVVLDLNGFALEGVPGSLHGININAATVSGITVRNGTIRLWGGDGIASGAAGGGFNVLFQALHVLNNGGNGLSALRAAITDCAVDGHGSGYGISVSESSVANCVVTGNKTGIRAFFNSSVQGCTGKFNPTGAELHASSMSDCAFQSTSIAGLLLRDRNRVAHNLISDGAADGIIIADNGRGNHIDENSVSSHAGTGIHMANLGVARNFMARNQAFNNALNYNPGVNNSYGPIVNVVSVGDITPTANSGHPQANFFY